jgi:hypothetical protein
MYDSMADSLPNIGQCWENTMGYIYIRGSNGRQRNATEYSLGFVEEVIKEMKNIPSKFPTINVD